MEIRSTETPSGATKDDGLAFLWIYLEFPSVTPLDKEVQVTLEGNLGELKCVVDSEVGGVISVLQEIGGWRWFGNVGIVQDVKEGGQDAALRHTRSGIKCARAGVVDRDIRRTVVKEGSYEADIINWKCVGL